MYISRLRVKGFHSLEDITIEFKPGLNVLIGKNNAGKSNIIRALDYVLGEKFPTYRDIEDKSFFRASDEMESVQSFSIVVGLSGSSFNASRIENIKSNLKIFLQDREPNIENLPDWICEAENGSFMWIKYSELVEKLGKPNRTIFLYLLVEKFGSRSYGLILKDGNKWILIPQIRSDVRDSLLTTAYIPSFRSPESQLRINHYSWYGKLIRHLYDQKTDAQKARIQHIQSNLSEIMLEVFKNTTESLEQRLKQAVFHHKISFRPGTYTNDDDYKQITLFVNDGIDSPFYDKGSGIQSALILALFSHYCQTFHNGSSLLLVEEPELYLHPQAKRAMEAQFVKFIEGDKENHQVIISTHSPEFMRSVSIEHLTLVCKPHGKVSTSIKQIPKREVRIERIIETKNAEMFFADHVILVEGGEEYLIQPMSDLFFGEKSWIDIHNVSVTRVHGKGQFKNYVDTLDRFGIRWTILTDLDFLKDCDRFSNLLDEEGQKSLGVIREQWKNLSANPTSQRVKDKVFDPSIRDWQELYQEIDTLVQEFDPGVPLHADKVDQIKLLWSKLKDRVAKPDIRNFIDSYKDDLDKVLSQFKREGIFILSNGELEDCFTKEALQLDTSKDLRAMKIAEEISKLKNWDEIIKFIDSFSDFLDLFQHIQQQLQN